MTRLTGMTLTQFHGLVEDMRKVYPFTDEQAHIINTHDPYTNEHTQLELYAHDEETGVNVKLSKGIEVGEDWFKEV